MPVSPDAAFWLSGGVVFFAALVHGLTGFGSALVAMPLLTMWMEIRVAAPLVALLTLTVNLVFLVRFRGFLFPERLGWLLLAAAAGVPVGIVMLKTVSQRPLELLLGSVLIGYGALSLHRRSTPRLAGKKWAIALGLASGCLGGAINTGGPPAVVYAASQPWKKEEVHASLQLFFLLSGLLVAGGHFFSGLTTAATFRSYLQLFPFLLAGTAAGALLHRQVSGELYRRLVFVFLLVLGGLLLVS